MLFELEWKENRISWSSSTYNGLHYILVNPANIWVPQLFILQTSRKVVDVGKHTVVLRLYEDGRVSWSPANVIKTTCSVDVTYFPFDTQTCRITLSG